jgi:thymidylate kinase
MRANTVCAGDEDLAARYFATQPLPDALVVLKVRPEEALARLQGRGKGPLLRHQNRSEASILEDLRRTARLVDTAVDVLRGRGLDVLVLDATSSVPANRRMVLDHLLATDVGR